MYSIRNLSIISIIILLILLIISIYFGIVSPPPIITYTTDENFIGESGIFLFYGNTPRALEWAAIPSTFIAYFLFLVWTGYTLFTQIGTFHSLSDILTIIDKNAFYYLNHRETFVIWERYVQIFLVGFIIFKTIQFIIHCQNNSLNNQTKFMLVLVCLCADFLWLSVPIIRPEALSASIFLYILIQILFTDKITPKSAFYIIFLFFVVITQRLIYLFLSPFVFISILVMLKNEKISLKRFLNLILISVVALFALMPFIITDTLVVMKSFLGGVFIKINHDPMASFFNMSFINAFVSQPMNIFFSIFALIGIWYFYKQHQSKTLVLIFLGNFFFFMFSSLKASQLYSSHTVPMSIMALILIGYGLGNIIKLNTNWKITLAGLLLLTNTSYSIFKNNREIKSQQANLADAIAWIKTLPNNEKIACELDFDGLLPKNKSCLQREFLLNASDNYRINKLNSLLKLPANDSLNKFSLPIVAQSFAFEDEKLFDTQYQIALKYYDSAVINRYDVDFFFESNKNMSHCLVQQEAFNNFAAGKYHYLVTKQNLSEYTPIKTFMKSGGDSFWVYEFKTKNIH
ncbi:hypothetical protein LV89_02359 [Arcicella aurantiaca]|uniref:Dolichyl-phosphate-mannose-protein mannosyltransferase n=1 Tax=Arcicella aurantiaca TaxID=591202 RepID=A0A316E7S9_9BACT|nr:hypothetical protein [Arcicella aurantiaca]PWK26514.1 hypothetical protein LV89_02359 [Arcicella aurantiaca]